jgi:predicted extracellular nuclease
VNKINADAVAAGLPNPNYNWCEFVTNDVGAIAIAILFKQSRVTITDCAQFGLNTLYTTPSGASDTLNDRPPVVFRGTITAPGSDSPFAFRVIGNHLRSLNGVDEPGASNGDRVRAKRNEQARYLGRLASGNLAEQTVNWSQTENLIVSGDMNAFEFSDGYGDSLGCIGGGPAPANQIYTTAAQSAVSPACTAITGLNLFNVTTGDGSQRYTFQFSGSLQRLDHILVNSLVAPRVRQFAYGRNNADFPEGPTYRSDFNRSERVSDHDIPVVYVQLPVEVTSRTRVNASPIVWNRVTNRYNGTISVTNTGAAALSGPIYVFFRNLPAGVTLPDLPQSGGAPYLTINGPLAPGATSSAVNISFAVVNNARISYTTQRFNGSF